MMVDLHERQFAETRMKRRGRFIDVNDGSARRIRFTASYPHLELTGLDDVEAVALVSLHNHLLACRHHSLLHDADHSVPLRRIQMLEHETVLNRTSDQLSLRVGFLSGAGVSGATRSFSASEAS